MIKLLVAVIGVFLAALVPRLAGLDAHVTIDESRWIQRAADFHALIEQGDPEDTFVVGHPGVTTMWTAFVGMGPERATKMSFREGQTDVTRRLGFFEALVAARLPFALLAAMGTAIVVAIAWRLFGLAPAVVGGGLIALEPFLIAHARVVHLDSALTVYSTIALLAALAWTRDGSVAWMAVSGIAAGLSFLTKAPSVFVLGFVPLLSLVQIFSKGACDRASLRRSALCLSVWIGLAMAVCLLLWPALRADPAGTLIRMAQFTERVGGGDHDNFFMGKALDDPGPLFYPLSLLLRFSPITLFGLLALATGWRLLAPDRRGLALTILVYCLGFTLMMSIAPKKFDRYILPIFPVLCLLAGLGLYVVSDWVFRRIDLMGELGVTVEQRQSAPGWPRAQPRRRLDTRSIVVSGIMLSLLALHAAPTLAIHPYQLAYYNPLLGGGAVAQRSILVGWGEGLDQVARHLNSQPRLLGEPTVATSYHRVLQAQLEGSALPLERLRLADFVVPYVNTLQRGAEREALAPFLESGRPEHVVRINGIEYARVYQGPHYPARHTIEASFGDAAVLAEYVLAPGSALVRPTEEIQILLRWARVGEGGWLSRVSLVNAGGRVVADDERIVGADGPDETGRPAELHRLTVPARTPPGEFSLAIRVLDARGRLAAPVSVTEESLDLRKVTVERAP